MKTGVDFPSTLLGRLGFLTSLCKPSAGNGRLKTIKNPVLVLKTRFLQVKTFVFYGFGCSSWEWAKTSFGTLLGMETTTLSIVLCVVMGCCASFLGWSMSKA